VAGFVTECRVVSRPPRRSVYLRSPTRADRDELLVRNRASARLYRGLATPMRTEAQFAGYLARCRRHDYVGLLVCRRDDEAVVGAFSLSQIVRGSFQSAYMGYQVFVPFDSQGYMRDAMPLVLRHVFATLKLHRVEANIQPANHASLALVKRAGFTLEGYSPKYLKIAGRWRDHERWAMLAGDWRRGKSQVAGPESR
jgi:[ribosomal protein S5]-alanine N-acetyltransferase